MKQPTIEEVPLRSFIGLAMTVLYYHIEHYFGKCKYNLSSASFCLIPSTVLVPLKGCSVTVFLPVLKVGAPLMSDIAGIAVLAQINTSFRSFSGRISQQNTHFY